MAERSVRYFLFAATLVPISAIFPIGAAIAAESGRARQAPARQGAVRGDTAAENSASRVSDAETAVYLALFSGLAEWNQENVEKLRQALPTLPEPAAAHIIWLVLSAPDSLDVSGIFSAALSAASPPGIRARAAEAIIDLPRSETRTRLLNELMAEGQDGDLAIRVINGMAAKPFPKSVRLLMEAMELIGSGNQEAVSAAAARLRSLTRANVPARAQAWLDWWRENSVKF
ncbi:MAG: hypothetical protein LBE84_03395 [Planctomycetota bacterium]|nr:hypothetical protein [Planctomycetota bacterium]